MVYSFFFKQKTAYDMRISDWSSDVCSSDLRLGASVERRLELCLDIVRQGLLGADRIENVRAFRTKIGEQALLELADIADGNLVEIAVHAGKYHGDLFFRLERRELRLLQEFGQAGTAVQQALGRSVGVRTEMSEGGHFAILGKLALDRAGNLLNRLDLRGRARSEERRVGKEWVSTCRSRW